MIRATPALKVNDWDQRLMVPLRIQTWLIIHARMGGGQVCQTSSNYCTSAVACIFDAACKSKGAIHVDSMKLSIACTQTIIKSSVKKRHTVLLLSSSQNKSSVSGHRSLLGPFANSRPHNTMHRSRCEASGSVRETIDLLACV